MSNSVDLVTDFLTQWNKGWEAVVASFERHLAEDVVWEQSGIPTLNSRADCIGLMNSLREGLGVERVDVEIVAIAGAGNVVLNEHTAHFNRADGSTVFSTTVAGTLELNEQGQVVRWREYFDPRPALALLGG